MCALVVLTGALTLAIGDQQSRRTTSALAGSLFAQGSDSAVAQTKDFVSRAGPMARLLEGMSGHGLAVQDLDKLAPQLVAFLKSNEGLTWVLYGEESTGDYVGATRLRDGAIHVERTHIANGKTRLTEYEIHDDGAWHVSRQDEDYKYDPRTRPFYLLAREKGKLAWTAPYMFFTQGLPGISCVIPLKGEKGELRGVFSVEFDLNALSEFVAAVSLSEHSRVFLFTPDGTLLAHPNQRTLAGNAKLGQGAMLTLADTGDPLVDAFQKHLKPEYLQHRADAAKRFNFFRFDHENAGYLASTTVFPIDQEQWWVVGAIAPESDFLATVWRTRWLSLAAALGALGLAALLAAAMARRISDPVQALVAFMQRVGAGDLDARADFRGGGREFRQLSAALNQMIADLRERLQLRQSLQVAMEVQKSLLPAGDPISPRLDIAGRSKYCDDTGGDYYDFIDVASISKSSLLIAVGDVMGHGIPAALVMATVRAALRTSAISDQQWPQPLADLMTRTNRVLAVDNRHNRFVTLSLLLIDAETRKVRWASAGHDPALVYDPSGGSSRELEGGDVPLGLMPDVKYEEFGTESLALESVIIIGTDGVWEMFNEQGEQYGKDRMMRIVRDHHANPAAQIAAALEADLTSFRGARNTTDDVTFVIVKFRP